MKIIKDVIALRFKTSESDGVILHGEGQQGDYITLELRKAKLLLQINLGGPHERTKPSRQNQPVCVISVIYCSRLDSNLRPFFITGSNQYGSILGHTSVTTGSLLDDNHWHSVVIERYRRNVNFTLDRHMQHFRTNGDFDHLDLDYEVRGGRLEPIPIICSALHHI